MPSLRYPYFFVTCFKDDLKNKVFPEVLVISSNSDTYPAIFLEMEVYITFLSLNVLI